LNSWPRDQKSHALPTDPARCPDRLEFLEQFYVHSRIEKKIQRYPLPPHTKLSPLSTFSKQSGTFVTYNSWTYIETSLSSIIHYHHPWLTLGVVHFMGFDKCKMTLSSHYSVIQNIFTVPKIPVLWPFISSYLPTPGNHWYFYWLYRVVSSRMSYRWNHTDFILFRVTTLPQSFDKTHTVTQTHTHSTW